MSDQAESNYRWFRENLSSLIEVYRGRHALIHDRQIQGDFQTSLEAVAAGFQRYGEGNFSVELVEESVEDLGFYSHVGSALHA